MNPEADERGQALRREIHASSSARRSALAVMSACCLLLIPWTGYLLVTLPMHYEARRWRDAWAGFDIGLLVALACTAYFGWRRRQALIPAALITATLLVCDAWFDVMLAWGTPDLWLSIASAALCELPLAAFLATRARRLLRYTLRAHWYGLGLPGEPPPLRRLPLLALPNPPGPRP